MALLEEKGCIEKGQFGVSHFMWRFLRSWHDGSRARGILLQVHESAGYSG